MKPTLPACALFLSLSLAPSVTQATGDGQLVVPTLGTTAVDPKVAPVLTELVLEALLTRHRLPALGPSDLKDMLDVEQQRQLLGCEDSRCLSELAGALGAARLVSGLVGRLGELYVVSLKLVDLSSAQVLARASKRFAKLEEAPEAIGPLVDELVGAKPQTKVDGRQLITARKEAEASTAAASVEDFCRHRAASYFSALHQGRSTADLLAARRLVLMDLLLTPFLTELESKLACLSELGQKAEARARAAQRAALTEDEATRARLARAEQQELSHGARLVEELYRLGVEKEKLGTGARPTGLTFALRPARLSAGGGLAESFLQTFAAAQAVVAAACRAIQEEKRADFVAQFSAALKDARQDPRDLYVARLSEAEAARLDACPVFALEAPELEARAKEWAERQVLRGCARQLGKKDGAPVFVDLELVKEGGAFKIKSWPRSEPKGTR